MYYQNNYSTINQQCGTPGFPSSQAVNVTNEFGNIYFSLPPPPPPPLIENKNNCVVPPVSKQLNSYEEYSVHLSSSKQCPFTSGSSPHQSSALPSLNSISRKKPFEKKSTQLPFANINVTSIKRDLMKCSALMKDFERLLNLLQVFKKTLSNEDWSSRCEQIKSREEEITKLLDKYENPEYILTLQRVISRCVKKRIYRKKKKKTWQEVKKINKAFREKEHWRIDMWLEKMKDQAETTQRQEQVKREADLVLAEVTAKKAEAKRYINLFNTLMKLRNARVQQLTASGSFVSASETKSFTEVIDKLKKFWIDQLKEYNIEEQGLRVMLNDAEVERVNVETKVNRQIQKEWNETLFGKSSIKHSGFPNSLDELIAIRNDWDRFINVNSSTSSSKIPVGWIVPSEPSNLDWSRFLLGKT